MRSRLALLAAALAACCVGTSSRAAQIVLNPSNVIGTSGSYNSTFAASNILDTQTGPVHETQQTPNPPASSGYWLNPDNGPANAYITVDLGASYKLGEIDLYNTHNAQFNDRGTGDFSIVAANAVTDTGGGNYMVTGPTTTLVSGTLAPASSTVDPIPAQAFTVTDTGSYRYLEFLPTSVATSGNSCCGANNYGLNEMRVFEATSSPVPEPASLTLLGLGVLGLAGSRCRRVRATA